MGHGRIGFLLLASSFLLLLLLLVLLLLLANLVNPVNPVILASSSKITTFTISLQGTLPKTRITPILLIC